MKFSYEERRLPYSLHGNKRPPYMTKSLICRVSVLLWVGIICAASFANAGVIPDGFPVNRYVSLWEHSPFTIASVQQEVAPEGFASRLALVGVAKIGSEDVVTLLNKESQERFSVGAKPDAQGLKIVTVEPNADPLKVSVTIQKGGETGRVKFDQTLLAAVQAAPGPPNNVAPQNVAPQQQPPNQGPIVSNLPMPPLVPLRMRRSMPIPTPFSTQPNNRPQTPVMPVPPH